LTSAVSTSTLLLLADGRLPTGGHVHSGGVEEAVTDGRIGGLADLGRYLQGRLSTTGQVDAALAAAAWPRAESGGEASGSWAEIDAEAAARIAAPALRQASRSQGRGLLRAARRLWPSAALEALGAVHPDGPSWSVALGAVARVAGVDRRGAALVAAQASITGPGWAAVRLLGLDPFSVAALLADLAPAVDVIAAEAAAGDLDLALLPAAGGPLTDVAAQAHASREVRLFAS
jgi:urease accessory protein